MAQQRNNIAKLPPPLRDLVSRLLYEGALTQDEIEASVRAEAIRLGQDRFADVRLHGTSFKAWRDSKDYGEYVTFARGWSDKVRAKRWAASALNEGRGPQSMADLAEMEILEQLHALAQDSELCGKDVATVARAITSLQRTQLARAESDRDHRIQAIETEHAQALAALQAELAERDTTIEQLRDTARKLAETEEGQSAVDPEERARLMVAVDDYMKGPDR